MGQFIVKLEGKYLLWSTIVDAPITFGMTLEELTEHVREEDGRRGVEELAVRLARVEAKGTSSLVDGSAEEVMRFNRAGPKEKRITVDEIAERYVRTRRGNGR